VIQPVTTAVPGGVAPVRHPQADRAGGHIRGEAAEPVGVRRECAARMPDLHLRRLRGVELASQVAVRPGDDHLERDGEAGRLKKQQTRCLLSPHERAGSLVDDGIEGELRQLGVDRPPGERRPRRLFQRRRNRIESVRDRPQLTEDRLVLVVATAAAARVVRHASVPFGLLPGTCHRR